MIAGLELPTSGEIYLGDEEVGMLRASERDIAFVFQLFALYPHMNVRNNLSFPLKMQGYKKSDIKNIDHHEKNYIKIFKFFLNTKYLWGGKTCDGIDCSALIQIYFYYNRIFFPRDTKDQIRFCKRKRGGNQLKGDIVFWKGHVGICLNKSRFIHAYGPKKKVLIMPTVQTIKLIDKTANLKVKKVSNINNI